MLLHYDAVAGFWHNTNTVPSGTFYREFHHDHINHTGNAQSDWTSEGESDGGPSPENQLTPGPIWAYYTTQVDTAHNPYLFRLLITP